MFLRRGVSENPFSRWQMVLLLFAAGVWVGGMVAGIRETAWVAIALALAGKILGMVGRRLASRSSAESKDVEADDGSELP